MVALSRYAHSCRRAAIISTCRTLSHQANHSEAAFAQNANDIEACYIHAFDLVSLHRTRLQTPHLP